MLTHTLRHQWHSELSLNPSLNTRNGLPSALCVKMCRLLSLDRYKLSPANAACRLVLGPFQPKLAPCFHVTALVIELPRQLGRCRPWVQAARAQAPL